MLNIWQDHHPLYFPPEDVQIGQRQGKARHSADIPMSLLYGIKSQFKQKVRSFWIGFYDIHPTNHTKTRFSCRQMPLHFFTAIQSRLCGKQRGKGQLPGGCFQAEALDLLCCTPSHLPRSDEREACLLLASHSLCNSRTAGNVPCQDSSAAWEHHRINVTFLHVKDHQLFFTFYSVLHVFIATMAKEKERDYLFCLATSLFTELRGDASHPM